MITEKVNFVSIPRTGTNSIYSLFGGVKAETNHVSIRKTKDDRFSFAVMRDPMRRLVSWWKYHKNPQHTEFNAVYGPSFNEWVGRACPHHWTPGFCESRGIENPLVQADFITDWDGEIIVDRVLNFDDLQRQFDIVMQPYLKNTKLPKLNASTMAGVSISRYSQQVIGDLFAKDLHIYNTLQPR